MESIMHTRYNIIAIFSTASVYQKRLFKFPHTPAFLVEVIKWRYNSIAILYLL